MDAVKAPEPPEGRTGLNTGDPRIMICSCRRAIAALFVVACLVTPLGARALSLLDLNAGASFASGDGNLMFSFEPGSIVLAGALSSDLSAYTVLVLSEGFQVIGPMAAADGDVGVLSLAYEVDAISGTLEGATLTSLPFAVGSGALAFLSMSASGLGDLVNAATGGGLYLPHDSLVAAGSSTTVVYSSLQLLTLGAGQLAAVSLFEQTFGIAVPEPSTGILLLSGLIGLALLGGRNPQGSE
ncbi:MAG: PEP-CTERM sorting domain-containing protein [bacterium]|nr:PEP-CTERM sorting domain-containing protein [bacterium]MCP5066055.1 PEP-CTERM sorting domain-containing protein [bacterium]